MVKFAVWGAGQKGKIILDLLGTKRVSCFIESNHSLHGLFVNDCPIVSYDKYCKDYSDNLIIISMLDCESVIAKLTEKNIPYVKWEKSSRALENSLNKIDDCYEVILQHFSEGVSLLGINTLSILLYDFLFKIKKKVSFLDIKNDKVLTKLLSDKGYKFNRIPFENILVTDGGWYEAAVKFPNVKITEITDLLSKRHFDIYEELYKFKDIHNNNRCFIIGNGPSLRIDDLDKLANNNEICFATNMIYKSFTKTKWRPQYYVVIDMAVLEKYGEQIKQLSLPCLFIGNRRTKFWDNCKDFRIHGFNDFSCLDMDLPPFSDDISRCVYGYSTVTYTCMQIAVYMGFKEIYLLGVDANYTGYASDENNHFIEDYYDSDDNQRIPVELERHFRAYQVANNYANKHGVKIFNATRGGKLEVFDRVDFDTLF